MKKTYDDGFREGAKKMRRRIVKALIAKHAREVVYDQCDIDNPCSQCRDWYRAIQTAKEEPLP